MSRRSYALLLSTIACLGWVMPGASAAPPAGNGAGASKSRLATFETSTGEKYFALSLSLDGTARDASQDQDIVVMLDTSASQAGAFRDDALAALESLAQGLGANDRVQIFAVDLRAVPMMPAFAPANAGDIAGAMNQLRQRAPLGSTDMSGALAAALRAFEGSRAASRSVIYIGDGVSRANFLASTEFESLVNALVDQQISVTSLAIGPERDIALLAALANHTGGALVVDNEGMTGQQSGQLLAQASRATVAWPVNATFAGGVKEYFPKKFPPLRSDRDSIVVGTLQGDASELTAQLKSNGQVHGQRWLLQAEPANADFDFLPHLVELARADGGMRLPTLGSDGLRESARVMQRNAEGLTRLSEHALVTGDLAGAKVAAEAAMKQDPANPEAALVRETAVKLADAGTRTTDTALRQVTPLAPAVNPETTEGGEGRLLGSVETSSALRSEVIQTEVEQGLNAARRKMSSSPELAKQDLILLLDSIDQATELPPEVRGQLRDRVQTAIREAARRQIEVASAQAQAQENQVAAIERLRLTEELDRRQAKIQQLLSRFNYLLEEGHFLAAEEDVAEQVRFLEPDSTAGVSALWRARTLKNVKEMQRFRDLRDRNFVDTLYRVEESAIPFPDEPPIVYPAADVWEQITMSRKQYKAVDLAGRPGSPEMKIQEALEKQEKFEYLDTPLLQVAEDISSRFGITVVLDRKGLEDAGLSTDLAVNANWQGISLRSALRLILNEHDLTYLIKDEVLQITTPDNAESNLVTKVYPVGDLVIPPIGGSSGGGGLGGGGLGGGGFGGGGFGGGGFGGGGGGFGGGGFGGGGGGFGGGGFGGGGGFFAVGEEDELRLEKPAQAAPAPAAKSESTAKKVEPIELKIPSGVSVTQAWEDYFRDQSQRNSAADRVDHAARVRETVRRLLDGARTDLQSKPDQAKARFGEIIAIIQAALRNGQAQSWMVESLTIAMIAQESPLEEIERALMSAVDVSRNEDEVLFIANYMTRVGLDERALKLFREVSQSSPMRPEPYVSGLATAKRLKDQDGIRWACLGILAQAWTSDQQAIVDDARRTAAAMLIAMKKAGRTDELQQFAKQVDEAVIRDCVVRVTWTGEADVDLMVEEPTATICSLSNRRTTAGGVLIGDAFANSRQKTTDGYSEIYVCPKGFSGQYRLFLRRVWGEVAAGKVTVEIWTGMDSKQQTYGKQQIPLGAKDAIVNFEVPAGRRTEPLDEEKVASVNMARFKQSQAILAQVLPGQTPETVSNGVPLFAAYGAARFDPRFFRRAGAVGYRPVVQQFPEGTQMTGLATISADRRYVRFDLLGAQPIQSGVSSVETFSFVSASGTNAGGLGGGLGGLGGGGLGGGGLGGGLGGGGLF